jgi:branched-chain amino acid aminotransferase
VLPCGLGLTGAKPSATVLSMTDAAAATDKIEFTVTPSTTPVGDAERAAVLQAPGFGRTFTDHMAYARWTDDKSWHDGAIKPYAPLQIDPATAALHYGQTIFEGFKAYRQPDGGIATFRPEENAKRFQRSARRLALPELPVDAFVEAADRLIRVDEAWVPSGGENSLYLRPFMIATEVGLGVRPSSDVTFLVIASPAGAYFPRGVHPVTIWLSEDYIRAAPGGTGAAKCGGNYAASLLAQQEAIAGGCDQVLFLDAVERRWVEELGGMNVFFVHDDGSIVTPELSGSILEGITRESILELARGMGHKVEERRVDIDEWREGARTGRITEVFACGTAAVITPLGKLKWRDGELTVGDGSTGPVTLGIRQALLDLQHGKASDDHGWLHRVP